MKINRFNEGRRTKEEMEETVQLLKDVMSENPLHTTYDFYYFVAAEKFEEDEESGLYKKTIDIENMCRITSDEQGVLSMEGIKMRARFQENSKPYHIWLPKDVRSMVEGNGSQNIEPWLNDLIDKNKQQGSDKHGKEALKNVKQRRIDIENFNI